MSKMVDNYMLTEVIGNGQYGKVYRAQHVKNGDIVAVKSIPLEKIASQPKLREFTFAEIENLSILTCPYIVKFFDKLQTSNNFYLVFEYCEHGTLEELLIKRKRLPERESQSILYQMTEAFKELNFKKIMHRDIKPSNIQKQNFVFKLADFGFCKKQKNHFELTKTIVGSPIYMAPELLEGSFYGIKADLWSIGVLQYEMQFGYCPYEEKTIPLLQRLIKSKPQFIPSKVSAFTENLLKKLLVVDASKRINWDEFFFLMDSYYKTNLAHNNEYFPNNNANPGYSNNSRTGYNATNNYGLKPEADYTMDSSKPANPYQKFPENSNLEKEPEIQNNIYTPNVYNQATEQHKEQNGINQAYIDSKGIRKESNDTIKSANVVAADLSHNNSNQKNLKENTDKIVIKNNNNDKDYIEQANIDIGMQDDIEQPVQEKNEIPNINLQEINDLNDNSKQNPIEVNQKIETNLYDKLANNNIENDNNNQVNNNTSNTLEYYRRQRYSNRLVDNNNNRTHGGSLGGYEQNFNSYEIKLDNKLEQRLDFYRNSNQAQKDDKNNNLAYYDRLSVDYNRSIDKDKNIGKTYENLPNSSREQNKDQNSKGNFKHFQDKDNKRVNRDWLDRLEDYVSNKGLIGFPGCKLKELQKENRNKFGEEFIEIILARFKMNYTVKVIFKLVQLLHKKRNKGTLLSDKKKNVPKIHKKPLTPIKEQKDIHENTEEGLKSPNPNQAENVELYEQSPNNIEIPQMENDFDESTNNDNIIQDDEEDLALILDEGENSELDKKNDKSRGSPIFSRKDSFGQKIIIDGNKCNADNSNVTTGLLELWIFQQMKKARQYSLSLKVKTNFADSRSLGIYLININVLLDSVKSEIENFEKVFTFQLKELENVTLSKEYENLLPKDQIYQTKLPFDLDTYIQRKNQLYASKRLLRERKKDFIENAEFANELLNVIMLDKYLHNIIDVKRFLLSNMKTTNMENSNKASGEINDDNKNDQRNSNVMTTESNKEICTGPELALFEFEESLNQHNLRKYVFVKLKVLQEEDLLV